MMRNRIFLCSMREGAPGKLRWVLLLAVMSDNLDDFSRKPQSKRSLEIRFQFSDRRDDNDGAAAVQFTYGTNKYKEVKMSEN